ncbi:hypothetical protein [Aliirhizobium cellulosilyticum]|uniref:SinR family protein n=1 Tax=Aliirhizobium cellulosilyticum TaxID=393664 RepID=A0A7W6SC52_9HYPH|nr:hypothetical protein [Rhizobium cellulosilyticum]MBB4351022.1 hypothetical protein [Rhizobium cellulosilyticum]MBB4413991.1 hypothetical protein [Rhizobium cellulosilyticum]MBB4448606.1 hypothetical protein [Rhizobium cellulosilyticum]
MTKYFSIATEGMTAAEEKTLAEAWRSYGWWHGIANFWLLRDHTEKMTAASIRDTIRSVAPTARVMVLDVEPATWAGSSLNQANREWLKSYWPPEGK